MLLAGVLALWLAPLCAASVYDEAEPGEGSFSAVHRGSNNAIVVISANPRRPAHVAAKEFVHYIEKITGVRLRIVPDAVVPRLNWSPRRILIGESELTRAYGLSNDDFEPGEFLIQSRDNDLILMGRDADEYGLISYEDNGLWPVRESQWRDVLFTDVGTMYAVHELLQRELGVRWYLPGEIGEVVPGTDTVRFENLNIRRAPWARHRWSSRLREPRPLEFYRGQPRDQYEPERVPWGEMMLHLIRMKVGGERVAANHSFGSYLERYGDEHAEWWGDDREPQPGHLDYLHPGLIERKAQDARDYFDSTLFDRLGPEVDRRRIPAEGEYFAVVPHDSSSGWVRTDEAEALIEPRRPYDPDIPASRFFAGWLSDYWFTVVNRVARKVARTHPDNWLSTLAYARYTRPPSFEVEPNVAVMVAGNVVTSFTPVNQAYHIENVDLWQARQQRVYVWEYYQRYQAFSGFRNFANIFPRRVAEGIGALHEAGIRGMFFEDSGGRALVANPAEQMLNRYVTWQLLDDASRDVDEMLEEHYRLFYGPAASPMRAFVEGIEARWLDADNWADPMGRQARFWEALCPPDVLAELRESIETALAMDLDDPYRTRVRMMHEAVYERMADAAHAYHSRTAPRPRVGLPHAGSSQHSDGARDDPWEDAASLTLDRSDRGRATSAATQVRIVRDDQTLYVRYECDGAAIEAAGDKAARADAAALREGASVELLLDPSRRFERFYHFIVAADGRWIERRVVEGSGDRGLDWSSDAEVSVHRRDDGYDVELAIPLAALQLADDALEAGRVWGANFARHGIALDEEVSHVSVAWSPTFGPLDAPEHAGVVVIERDEPLVSVEPTPSIHYDLEALKEANVSDLADHGTARSPGRVRGHGGAGIAPDSSTPTTEPGFTFGRDDDAYRWIEVDLAPTIDLGRDDFTVSFWYRTDEPTGTLIHSGTTRTPYMRLWFADYGRDEPFPCFIINLPGDPQALVLFDDVTPNRVADGQWHHWLLAVDRGRDVRLYIDGEPMGVGSLANARGAFPGNLQIGGVHNPTRGAMGRFKLFRGTWGPDLARALYDRERRAD